MGAPAQERRSDQQLVAAINGGDKAAFDALYFRYRDWVARVARRMTGSEADALDVLQETFCYLFRTFPGFVLSAKMTTFLYPVVRNLAIAARRKRQRMAERDESVDPPAPEQRGSDREEIATVIGALPEGQREVLMMRFVDGLSLAEIAEALEIPTGTVKSRLHNALAALKEDERVRRYFEPEK